MQTFYDPFGSSLSGDVLEIGAGCGAITRYLGECGGNVLAIEGSQRRAAIASCRTRDLSNVTVLAEKFEQFQSKQQFDVITLIGVLEYASLFTAGDSSALTLLNRARSFLKPDGKLIIAIENQLGLKYFAGAPEDHLGQPMYGIEGRYGPNQPKTFGRKVLANLLEEAGFATAEFLAPFPDYKLPLSILTEKGLFSEDFDGAALAWQSVRHDPLLPQDTNFSLELAWPEIFKNQLALDMANSFLIAASPLKQHIVEPSILAFHYRTDRLPRYCKETIFEHLGKNRIAVNCQVLGNRYHNNETSEVIAFTCPDKASYAEGVPLSWEFIKIVTRPGWSIEEVGGFVRRFIKLLSLIADRDGIPLDVSRLTDKLPGSFFDVVPQNIIIRHDGQPAIIDTEWSLKDDIELGMLLFRSLLWSTGSVCFSENSEGSVFSRRTFIKAALEASGYRPTDDDLLRFTELESTIQQEVRGHGSLEDLKTWLEQPISTSDRAVDKQDEQTR